MSELESNIEKSLINQLTLGVFMPGKEEQEKIGSLFSTLENTITLHQRE